MRTLLKPIAGLLIAAFLSLAIQPPSSALARSRYTADEIEMALIEFYAFYNSENSEKWNTGALTGIDKTEVLTSVSEMLTSLRPNAYNDVLGHLALDYRNNPDHRSALEELLPIMHAQIAFELKADKEYHPAFSVIDGLFEAWGWMTAFGFGRGAWISRGRGLGHNPSFARLIENVRKSTPGWKTILISGTAVGVADAILVTVRDKRLDPSRVLDNEQSVIINHLAVEMAKMRDELKKTLKTLESLPEAEALKRAPAIRKRLTELQSPSNSAYDQVAHFESSAPQYRGILEPIKNQHEQAALFGARIENLLNAIDDQGSHDADEDLEEEVEPAAKKPSKKASKRRRVIP